MFIFKKFLTIRYCLRRHLQSQHMKEDMRKFGLNLVTACLIAIFISHLADLTHKAAVTWTGLAILGLLVWAVGIYKSVNKED